MSIQVNGEEIIKSQWDVLCDELFSLIDNLMPLADGYDDEIKIAEEETARLRNMHETLKESCTP